MTFSELASSYMYFRERKIKTFFNRGQKADSGSSGSPRAWIFQCWHAVLRSSLVSCGWRGEHSKQRLNIPPVWQNFWRSTSRMKARTDGAGCSTVLLAVRCPGSVALENRSAQAFWPCVLLGTAWRMHCWLHWVALSVPGLSRNSRQCRVGTFGSAWWDYMLQLRPQNLYHRIELQEDSITSLSRHAQCRKIQEHHYHEKVFLSRNCFW